MNSITPTYMPSVSVATKYRFTLLGEQFLFIPEGSEGVLAWDSNNPTNMINSGGGWRLDMVSRTNEEVVFSRIHQIDTRTYLGCIVSPNNEILWVNDTHPYD